jgi:LPS sulfotransferase NodH
MLLPRMPAKHDYKLIFMRRPIAEVVASQQTMTTRLGTKGADLDSEQLARGLRAHREDVRRWATAVPHVALLEIEYPTLVREPLPQISRLIDFLGKDRLPNSEQMATVVDPSLYRKRV